MFCSRWAYAKGVPTDDVIDRQDGHQHEQRPDERENEELDCGVETSAASPDPDDEIHRDQHDLPEDVEHKQIKSDEHTEHARGEHQKERIIRSLVLFDVVEASQHSERHGERGEQHHKERDAVHTEVIRDPPIGYPRVPHLELHGGGAGLEGPP